MYIVEYVDRYYIDNYTCKVTRKTLKVRNYFISGGLYYFKVNDFNYIVLSLDDIITIDYNNTRLLFGDYCIKHGYYAPSCKCK